MHKKLTQTGFTAIELIVVIAIIAGIMAMGLYWLSGARYSARLTTSSRNLIAIGQMLEGYRADHRGAYPFLIGDGVPTADNKYGSRKFTSAEPDTTPYIGDKLFPKYCSDPSLFYCPLSSTSFVQSLWYRKEDGTWNKPAGVGWSYTYLAAHYSEGHVDEDVRNGRVLAQTCSLYGKYNRTGDGEYDRETVVLYSDHSVKIESKFKW